MLKKPKMTNTNGTVKDKNRLKLQRKLGTLKKSLFKRCCMCCKSKMLLTFTSYQLKFETKTHFDKSSNFLKMCQNYLKSLLVDQGISISCDFLMLDVFML
jgi:hypothetical protein